MKLAITSSDKDVNSFFDNRFGRAAWFCIYEEEKGNIEFYKNEFMNLEKDAGVNVAKKMKELGVDKIISGDFGSKTNKLLIQYGIQMIIIEDENYTIQDIINKIQ